jgi:hypothetical protein
MNFSIYPLTGILFGFNYCNYQDGEFPTHEIQICIGLFIIEAHW